jgi:dienelactone hydrolase
MPEEVDVAEDDLGPVRAPAFQCPETRQEFERFRERTREAALDFIGRPPFETAPPLNPQIVDETDAGTYVRKKVRYGNESDDVVWAWLLVPKAAQGPTPTIICLAGSFMTPNYGKDAPAGLVPPLHPGHPETYGADLAELGYITLCPDYPCCGERTTPGLKSHDTSEFDERFPTWTRTGMSVWDVSRALDFLETVPKVDPSRIGCTGWSQGGLTTLWGAALDERIAVAIPVCGWSPLRGNDPDPLTPTYNFPRLRRFVEEGRPLSFDMDHLAAMIAPRSLLNVSTRDDHHVPNKEVVVAAEVELAKLYAWLGVADRFRAFWGEGDHVYSPEVAQASRAWFDRWLREGAGG